MSANLKPLISDELIIELLQALIECFVLSA